MALVNLAPVVGNHAYSASVVSVLLVGADSARCPCTTIAVLRPPSFLRRRSHPRPGTKFQRPPPGVKPFGRGAAWVLNCQSHDIPILVAARLLRPLGNPAPNATKFFSTDEVLGFARDRSWLVRITSAVSLHSQKKNGAKREYHSVRSHLNAPGSFFSLRKNVPQAELEVGRGPDHPADLPRAVATR